MSAPQDDYKPTDAGAESSDVPIVSDSATVEDPIDAASADSDAQLAKDDSDAIDQGNIIKDRTRGAAPSGGYAEPGDDEGLGGPDDGRSNVAGGPN